MNFTEYGVCRHLSSDMKALIWGNVIIYHTLRGSNHENRPIEYYLHTPSGVHPQQYNEASGAEPLQSEHHRHPPDAVLAFHERGALPPRSLRAHEIR